MSENGQCENIDSNSSGSFDMHGDADEDEQYHSCVSQSDCDAGDRMGGGLEEVEDSSTGNLF